MGAWGLCCARFGGLLRSGHMHPVTQRALPFAVAHLLITHPTTCMLTVTPYLSRPPPRCLKALKHKCGATTTFKLVMGDVPAITTKIEAVFEPSCTAVAAKCANWKA